MYELQRINERIEHELNNSRLPFALKVNQYDMSKLKNDYYEALMKSFFREIDEDDRLLYFILVIQDILKLELSITIDDVDTLHQETYDLFAKLIIENMDKN